MARFLYQSHRSSLSLTDGLVPTLELEEWDLYQEDGPLLRDHFLGVDELSGDMPPSVVFVEPNTPQNTNGELYGNINTTGFYDEYTAPSWLEHNVDLNDLDAFSPLESVPSHGSSSSSSSASAPFYEPSLASQNFIIPDPYGISPKVAAYPPEKLVAQQTVLAPTTPPSVQQTRPQMKKPEYYSNTNNHSDLEHSDYYSDAFPASSVSSVYSPISWTTEEEYLSKEAILEEIHREAAEIERNSVSPPGIKVRTSRKTKTASSTPRKSRKPRENLPKPYVERKKELNRAAATKYREKKRIERDYLNQEKGTLETRNTELKAEVSALSSELEYLKKLIKDIEARTKH